MRHYVIAGHLLGQAPSGATRRTLAILRALPSLLATDERITVLHDPALPAARRIDGIAWHAVRIPCSPTWRRALAERRTLPRAAERLAASVLDLGALPVPPHLPCPVALTVHDLRDLEPGLARRPRWLARIVVRQAVERAAHVIVPSRFTAECVRRIREPRAVTVVPGGVDDQLLSLAPRSDPAHRYFLHVGHLERRKDLGTLIAAYARCRDLAGESALPDLVLVGADHGDARAVHDRASALGIAGHVRLTGAVEDEVLLALYAGATAVAVPSVHEGFGLPALEALAVGVPVLVADAGASPEVVGTAGEVLPPGDVDAWAGALLASADRALSPLDVETRKAHARRFSWRRSALATLAVWRRIVE